MSATPNQSTCNGDMRPLGKGRSRVRTITWSMSRSTYWLTALAPPAARNPPTMVQRISQKLGAACPARNMGTKVTISSSEMMRGLVSIT